MTVTELPGSGASSEQLAMLQTRYHTARELARGKEILEVACGPGIGLGYLAKQAKCVVGGDFDPNLVEVARRHYGDRIEILQLDAQDLPFPDESFDVVALLEALYYLPKFEAFVAEARRVLRSGGRLFICSANCEREDFNKSPYSTRYYSAKELRDLLEQYGFQVEMYGAFPVDDGTLKSTLMRWARLAAIRLRLIPDTMEGKERLKRLIHGKLTPLPAELGEETAAVHPLVAIDVERPVREYKVIYAIAGK